MDAPAATNASLAAVRQTILGYAVALAAHLNGDWGQHAQLNLTASIFSAITSQTSIPSSIPSSQSCRITGIAGIVNSVGNPDTTLPFIIPIISTAVVAGINAPEITMQPIGAIITSTYTLNVTAIGQAPLSYQWYKNGNPIVGAHLSTLTLLPSTSLSDGVYTVLVSNQVGSVLSAPATISVQGHPGQVITPSNNSGGFNLLDVLFPF